VAVSDRLDDKPTPNPPLAHTILCELDSSRCSWFSLQVRDGHGKVIKKSRCQWGSRSN
jgi:hypothetical protein